MTISSSSERLSSGETAALMQRICEHLGIAFSANRVFPSLADLNQGGEEVSEVAKLNAIGKHFGIRFREMVGSLRDLNHTVSDSGLILVRPKFTSEDEPEAPILVLTAKSRSKFLINQHGEDSTVPLSWLKKNLEQDEEQRYHWLLIQPILAAEQASRFHYQSGTLEEPLTPIRRFVAFLKPEAPDVRAILVFSIIIGLLSLTTPLAVEAVVNTIAFGRYLQPLIVLSLIVLVFLGFRAGLNVLMTIVTEIIQRKIFVRTVEDLSYRLTRVPLSTWKKYHGPELVNRFFDIVSVQKITAKLLLDSLMLGLQTIIGLTVLAFYHPFLLGYDIGLLAMMSIVLTFIGRGAIKTAKDESQLKYETAAWLQEIVRHPTTFKFNGGLGFAINRADELAAQYIFHRQQHFKILIKQISFAMVMQVIAATTLLALGGYLVIDGQMTLGQLVAAELIVTVILGSFAKLGKDLESFYDLMASVDKLGKLFDLPVERIDKLELARQPGAYGMQLVDIALDSQTSQATTVSFDPCKTYAIYGSSELRREKLIETLVGQAKPQAGHVLLNDYRVDAISAESLQKKISLVREIELFEGTVDENLRMGRENVGSAQANDVISRLGLRKTLAALPDGLGTRVSICGYPLSSGQAIRLVLARALISKPGILFVDGLLDRLSDDDTGEVLASLNTFAEDTTIVISTGRRAIARWAEKTLEIESQNWVLAKFDG
ncbi:MAG: putative ABC transport system ATP-binding protein [Mariniblastus sp.]|jgi:putative ABC transport system ATP-binding protein